VHSCRFSDKKKKNYSSYFSGFLKQSWLQEHCDTDMSGSENMSESFLINTRQFETPLMREITCDRREKGSTENGFLN